MEWVSAKEFFMTGKMWLWLVYVLQAAGIFFGFIPWVVGIVIWMVKGPDMESAVLGGAHRRWQNVVFWLAFGGSLAALMLASMGIGMMIGALLFFILLGCVGYGMFCLFADRAPMRG